MAHQTSLFPEIVPESPAPTGGTSAEDVGDQIASAVQARDAWRAEIGIGSRGERPAIDAWADLGGIPRQHFDTPRFNYPSS